MECEIKKESPEYLRMSLAAAMTLDFKQGLFYRNAKLHCINLLLTYEEGCAARCSYCGLSNKRPGEYAEKSFIRVSWPSYSLNEIIDRIKDRPTRVKRVCISMVTRKRAVQDTIDICTRIRTEVPNVPVSLLISPTVVSKEDLVNFKKAGADKIGVAVDLATPELFDKYRGKEIGGPHKWTRYWECYAEAIDIFGVGNVGTHLMTGMGETEAEMVAAIQKTRDMGGDTHLFSFFPENDSAMADFPQPPMEQYRRIQLARYLIDNNISSMNRMTFDSSGEIIDFGIPSEKVHEIIELGTPFCTSGCVGNDGLVACNRPYGNSKPGTEIRNYPFQPDERDILRIKAQMGLADPIYLSDED